MFLVWIWIEPEFLNVTSVYFCLKTICIIIINIHVCVWCFFRRVQNWKIWQEDTSTSEDMCLHFFYFWQFSKFNLLWEFFFFLHFTRQIFYIRKMNPEFFTTIFELFANSLCNFQLLNVFQSFVLTFIKRNSIWIFQFNIVIFFCKFYTSFRAFSCFAVFFLCL